MGCCASQQPTVATVRVPLQLQQVQRNDAALTWVDQTEETSCSAAHMTELLSALCENTHVTSLGITPLRGFGEAFKSAAAVQALSRMIACNRSIASLTLLETIPCEHVPLLASGFQPHSALIHFFFYPLLDTKDARPVGRWESLFTALLQCASLMTVTHRASVGADAADALAELVRSHGRLAYLSVDNSNLRGDPLRRVMDALAGNKHLIAFALTRLTSLIQEDVRAVADMLRQNVMLRNLSLAQYDIGPVGAAILADALRCNHTLTTLLIEGGGDDAMADIKMLLHENETQPKEAKRRAVGARAEWATVASAPQACNAAAPLPLSFLAVEV